MVNVHHLSLKNYCCIRTANGNIAIHISFMNMDIFHEHATDINMMQILCSLTSTFFLKNEPETIDEENKLFNEHADLFLS